MLSGAAVTLARRYAKALLDVGLGAGSEKGGSAEAIAQALGQARALVEGNAELQHALAHPAVPVEARLRVAKAVFASAPPALQRLVALLVERGRVVLLGPIEDAYAAAWSEHRGAVRADAVSASPLDQAQTAALVAALAKATGKDVELRGRVDPAVLGGLKVTVGGRTYDGTVEARLVAMRRVLQGTA
jgi:F-type H+-transporting ATPase subunit delta